MGMKISKIIFIAIALPIVLMVFYIFVQQWNYLEIRDTLFTDNLNESASRMLIRSAPSSNLLTGIGKDFAAARKISDNVYGAQEISKIENLPTIQKIPLLVKLNYGIGGAGCGTVADIETKAKIMKYNFVYGCCSDFSKVFTLVAIATKTVVREVVTDAHTFSEAWLPEFEEWVFVDSQFGLMARSKTSRSGFASVEELRYQILNGSHDIAYLGKDSDAIYINKSIQRYYLQKEFWGSVRYLDSMEVVSQSALLSKLQLQAKAISHLIGYLVGVIPRFSKVNWPAENSI
jgi:hypothetical protein